MESESRKRVLVTGASRGIGRAISQRLLQDGHSVIGMARDFGASAPPEPDLRVVEIDLGDLDGLERSIPDILRDVSPLDGVVFNVGRGEFGGLEEFSYRQIRSLVDLNFLSAAFLARALLPEMKRRGEGDLIFIGSEAALAGHRRGAVYCASKFALRGFAQALREECASSGLRVSIIQPGMVRTGFFDDLDFHPGEDEENSIRPEDIADVVAAIISSRRGTNFDEIILSPLKKVIRFRSPRREK